MESTIIPSSEPSRFLAVILAAGQGSRLKELGKETPKCLLEVGGRPILHHQLSALGRAGVRKVAIVIGFRGELIKEYASRHFPGFNFTFVRNRRFASTNTLYSLALASRALAQKTSVLLLNGDVVFDKGILKRLVESDVLKSYAAAIPGKCDKEEVKFVVDRNGAITALNKKISPAEAVGEAVGVNKFSPRFWKQLSKNLSLLQEDFTNEYFEYAVERTIADGEKLFPFDIGKLNAIEIDFPKDLELARRWFAA